MRVSYTERAVEDLGAILDFLDSRNPTAAKKVLASIRASIRVLGKHPLTGRRQDVDGLRKAVSPPSGHLVYYGVDDASSTVSIFAIQAPSRERFLDDA